jgi:hypothetical protein
MSENRKPTFAIHARRRKKYVTGFALCFHDPKGRPMDEVRAVRDNIKVRVAGLIQAEGLEKKAA